MEKLTTSDIFAGENSPGIVLIDVAGRRNRVMHAVRAQAAIEAANEIQALGGTGRFSYFGSEGRGNDTVIIHYQSATGRPTKSEIARAARVIARSAVRPEPGADNEPHVVGSRAIVYAETLCPGAATAVFLVSATVWFNHNRAVKNWPWFESQEKMFLDDINERLSEGKVSIAR